MKSKIIIKQILSVYIVLFILVLAVHAIADSPDLQYTLNKKYAGASPASRIPWLTAVFDNNDINDKEPNKVLLTMSAPHLTGTEDVRMWFFNFTLNPDNLSFTHISGPKAIYIRKGNDCCRASGTGNYDFEFIFRENEFDSGKTSVYEISYVSPITITNFSEQSTKPGGSNGGYGSAALINDINGDNKLLGWIGDDNRGMTVNADSIINVSAGH